MHCLPLVAEKVETTMKLKIVPKVLASGVVVVSSSQLDSSTYKIAASTIIVVAPAVGTVTIGVLREGVVVVGFLASL